MKKRLIALSLISAIVIADPIRLSAPVAQDEFSETFGAPMTSNLPQVSLSALLNSETKPERFQLTTKIAKVCQKKGCFFMAQEGEQVVRVSFKDYGFFIPTDSSNKVVTLTVTLVEKQLNAKQAAHFNQDMGAQGVVKTGAVYEIVADSVTIPKA